MSNRGKTFLFIVPLDGGEPVYVEVQNGANTVTVNDDQFQVYIRWDDIIFISRVGEEYPYIEIDGYSTFGLIDFTKERYQVTSISVIG